MKLVLIGRGNQLTRRKPSACHLSLTNLLPMLYQVHLTEYVNRLNRAKRYVSVTCNKRNDLSHDLLDYVYNCTALWQK